MLSGTTEASRKIQGYLHTDPYAAYEDSSSKEFKTAVKDELSLWKTQSKPDFSHWLKQFTSVLSKALPKTKSYAQTNRSWNGKTIYIQNTYNHQQNVWIDDDKYYEVLTQFILGDNTYATIADTGEGSEEFTLSVYSKEHVRLWHKTPVGPDAAYKDNRIYFQTVENRLRYPGVLIADEMKGTPSSVGKEETDPKVQLELIKPPYQQEIFIKASNALTQRLGMIVGNSEIRWLTEFHLSTIVPLNKEMYLSNDTIVNNGHKTKLPKNEYGIDGLVYKNTLYIITVKKGNHTLYEVKNTFKKIKTCPAMRFLKKSETPKVLCDYHWKPSEVFDILEDTILLSMPSLLSLNHIEGTIKGIPYTIVFKGHPKRLVVTAYGAYGIESQRGYPIRWLPWIENGYALAVAMPRGGRDDGDAWWNEARTAPRKHRTFEDTAEVIKAVQKRLHIGPLSTLFYGRSAGGWVAAMMALQYPYLVRGVIAEVPYVDVLRTTSNPALPLTQMEYEEFGDPLHNKKDYEALLTISPIENTSVPPKTQPIILIKTALHDTQVATYESLKWAKTLREKGWSNIYVSIDTKGGHFVGQNSMANQYAEDASFFHKVFRGRDTRKISSHFKRGTTRRATRSSKH
jgi:protease II